MGSLLLLYGCWQVFGWTPGHRPLVGDLLFFPAAAAATCATWRASQRCSDSRRLRSAWRLIALAMAAMFSGEIAQTVYEAQNQAPFPSVADVFYLSMYPLMLWGLLRFAVGNRTVGERVRLGLDLAVVAIGSSAVVLYLVLGPTVVAGSPNLLQGVFSVAYPVGDVVLLIGLASVLVRDADPSARRALWFLAAGLLLYVIGDVIFGYISLHSTYQGGDPVDMFWVTAIALWAVAGAAQIGPDAPSPNIIAGRLARTSWAPYIGVGVGFAVLILVQRHDPFFPDICLSLTAVVIAALVSARQFLAQRDLMSMQKRSSYESLHDALTGVPNRRRLIIDLSTAIASATHTAPRTLAMFDLDGFKSYNDTYGHLAGDQLLTRVAHRLTASVSSIGRAYRLGGDEFCVLLDTTQDADQIVARAAQAMSDRGTGFAIGASFGIASIPNDTEDLTAALQIADTRMYAKKNGTRAATFIAQTRDVLLRATAEHASDLREHMLDVGKLSRDVARRLGLDAEMLDLVLRTGELHDVGKVAIPTSVLSKPGPLNDDEWALIRSHTIIAQRILNAAPALQAVAKFVRSTHERYDGTGYPDGLRGQEIPLPSRIVFACDAFHAMTSRRPYAPTMSEAQACRELKRCAGTHFDPQVIEVLLAELAQPSRLHLEAAPESDTSGSVPGPARLPESR
jgi:two-component system cell cycle response regulator